MNIPKDLLNKEFLSQFKTEEDVSKFLTDLHARVLEQMLEGELDAHLGYEKHSVEGNNSGNSRNGKYGSPAKKCVCRKREVSFLYKS